MTTDVESAGEGEPIGRLRVALRPPRSFAIEPDDVPGIIDEIPALAALAAMMPPGTELVVRGAAELRVKESDRISALAAGLRAMGAEVEEFPDGFHLRARPLRGATVDACDDHRLAMAFAVAATRASSPTTITGASAVDVSYPGSSRRSIGSRAVTVDKIYLVGFMAAGKTTVARALAARLGWRAEDVDELIEARERRTVADIFARQRRAVLPRCRAGDPAAAAAAASRGRGDRRRHVRRSGEPRRRCNRDGLSVWLDVPFEEVLGAAPADGRRPLAADRAQMERLFTTRQLAYAQAHLRVDARGLRAEAVVERIIDGITQMERRAL